MLSSLLEKIGYSSGDGRYAGDQVNDRLPEKWDYEIGKENGITYAEVDPQTNQEALVSEGFGRVFPESITVYPHNSINDFGFDLDEERFGVYDYISARILLFEPAFEEDAPFSPQATLTHERVHDCMADLASRKTNGAHASNASIKTKGAVKALEEQKGYSLPHQLEEPEKFHYCLDSIISRGFQDLESDSEASEKGVGQMLRDRSRFKKEITEPMAFAIMARQHDCKEQVYEFVESSEKYSSEIEQKTRFLTEETSEDEQVLSKVVEQLLG